MANYRLTQISVCIQLPLALSPTDRTKLEQASKTCPVYRALDPKLKVCVKYLWPVPFLRQVALFYYFSAKGAVSDKPYKFYTFPGTIRRAFTAYRSYAGIAFKYYR